MQRKAWFDDMVAKEHEKSTALSSATYLEVDDVIPTPAAGWRLALAACAGLARES